MVQASTFNEQVYLALPEESQLKVELIYNIANMFHSYGLSPLNTEEFDLLYDRDVKDLEQICNHTRFRLLGLEEG